jgi:hypothetical protein
MPEEKKGGKYEEPESKEVGGDDLEDVSGGAPSICQDGGDANVQCVSGPSPTGRCSTGSSAYYHAGCDAGSSATTCQTGGQVSQ